MSIWINDQRASGRYVRELRRYRTASARAWRACRALGERRIAAEYRPDSDPNQEFGGIALSINNKGQVVGGANQPDGSFRPFLWSRHSGVRMLDVLPGGVGGGAVGINDEGDAVGQSFDANGDPSPVIWLGGGDPENLNDLAPHSSLYLLWPTTINSRGEISGFGLTGAGDVHGFLATPYGSRADHAESVENSQTRPPVLSENVRRSMRDRFGPRRQ